MEAGFCPTKRLGMSERTFETRLFARRPLPLRRGLHAFVPRSQPRQINKFAYKSFLTGNTCVVFFVNFIQPLCYINYCRRVGLETLRLKEPFKRRFFVGEF